MATPEIPEPTAPVDSMLAKPGFWAGGLASLALWAVFAGVVYWVLA